MAKPVAMTQEEVFSLWPRNITGSGHTRIPQADLWGAHLCTLCSILATLEAISVPATSPSGGDHSVGHLKTKTVVHSF